MPLEQYEVDKVEGLGSTYSATLSDRLTKNPDTVYLYQPFVEHQYFIYYEGPVEMNVIDMSRADEDNKYRIFLTTKLGHHQHGSEKR